MITLNIVRSGAIPLFQSNMLRLRIPQTSTFEMTQSKSTNIDVLDIFTTKLLSQKSASPTKFQPTIEADINRRSESETKAKLKVDVNNDSKYMVNWSEDELDRNLMVSMDCEDRKTFDEIVEQMLTLKRLPSEKLIVRVLCHLCDDSENSMNTISHLIDLCGEINLEFYAKNLDFEPFLSQHLWKCQRFDDALNTLNSIYGVTNKTTKSLILRNYRQIIYDAVKNQDESIVDKVIFHVTQINDRYNESILIIYTWSDCFFSELFRNQKKAEALFIAHDVIRTAVSKDIGWIALTLLKQHNIDAMHRLIEQCLAENLKKEVGICLTALFDYHYWRNDLRACSEVMSTSLRLKTNVTSNQNQKLLNLLLKKTPDEKPPSKPSGSRFEFKF
ncbi:uncharacterized protein LOC116339119 [Contarinia nasturtii]|uniref:uncharacterized protein LOC116339119 n=1 Tax=Contarinia nasturtii TaxID=265458 RepID=UPI0012D3B503|nr:uncharacterized protein LOC116339119 [Contarinia nasturtii]